MKKSFRAFTLPAAGGLRRELITDVTFCAAFDPASIPASQHPPMHSFKAIWDTGATNTMISADIVAACGLKPFTQTRVTGIHSSEMSDVFLVNVGLPNGVAIASVPVTLGRMAGATALIGMDIITRGDFSITNVGGHTTFTFRVPSIETVDFVKDANRQNGPAWQPFVSNKKKPKGR